MPSGPIFQVAVPSPLRRVFDYLPCPDGPAELPPGTRVRVPFGRSESIGIVLGTSSHSEIPHQRLKPIRAVLDPGPVLTPAMLALAQWASQYYRHPLGEVLSAALPVLLRQGRPYRGERLGRWRLTPEGAVVDPSSLGRSPRQAAVLSRLRNLGGSATAEQLRELEGDWRGALRALGAKRWVEYYELDAVPAAGTGTEAPLPLAGAQADAVAQVCGARGFSPFLLYGVTGSGKTEVYLQIISQALAHDRQALVLVPEIGLTPQLVQRFRERFAVPLAVLHSGRNEQERLNAWVAAARGEAPIVLGTRSAIFTPLARPGILIVDEEHDNSFKQQDGLRYSARDLALVRARQEDIPVVLASATPALESLHNAWQDRYRLLQLPERAGNAVHPRMELLDVRSRPMHEGLAENLLQRMAAHVARGGQVLLFLNRRGFAPTVLCHDCGWVAECHRCDAHMTLHHASGRLRCHHCGAERPVDPACPACGSVDLRPIGQGTERLEGFLRQRFTDLGVVRIDRDSTRRKGALEEKLASVQSGASRILLGTQMLTKGHHFPEVTLVGVVDADQGLFSSDFRAGERMAQLVIQVAGRAGRAQQPGEVVIQTHHPDHPLLQALVRQDYLAFARMALAERRETRLPPFASLALIRAEAPNRDAPALFLDQVSDCARQLGHDGVEIFGPVPAPMERRQGRYRAMLLLQAEERGSLQRLLTPLAPALETLPKARAVRWSLDVDPVDTF